MEMELKLKEKTPEISERKPHNYELADRLYVFCPGSNIGIEIIVQQLSSQEQKFAGTLPEGFILSSGKPKKVSWAPEYGIKTIGYKKSDIVMERGSNVNRKIIVVSDESLIDLINQFKNQKTRENGYYLLDLNKCIADIENVETKKGLKINKLTDNSKYIKNKK